jgi:hypothetical protein
LVVLDTGNNTSTENNSIEDNKDNYNSSKDIGKLGKEPEDSGTDSNNSPFQA